MKERGPIRVVIVGAGTAARMIARRLARSVEHIRLVAVVNRTLDRASQMVWDTCGSQPIEVSTRGQFEATAGKRDVAVSRDVEVILASELVDVVIEATGTVEFGAKVVLLALEQRKHVVLVNAELDSTLGPILKARADAAGVVLTHTDGDEPGVAMTLVRYLRSIGLRPVAAGNVKGLLDRYRTPTTQQEFAAKLGQDAYKVTSFADGTKLSMETTVLANATGFQVGRRGMYGIRCGHVNDLPGLLPPDQLLGTGLLDYALGAAPFSGIFVIVHEDDPVSRQHLEYFKLGTGPFYVFYTPYHLPSFQIISSITRAAILSDATVAPLGAPVCHVAATAKRSLRAGEVLDGVGGYMAYGEIVNAKEFEDVHLLPIGLAGGCTLLRDLAMDAPITYDDVSLPTRRLGDTLHVEQANRFARIESAPRDLS